MDDNTRTQGIFYSSQNDLSGRSFHDDKGDRATVSVARRSGGLGDVNPALLGSNAKYKNKAEKVDPETGEITGYKPVFNPMDLRVQRFALQSAARSLFPKSRIDKCLRLRQKGKEIQVLKSVEHKTASYSGLQTCGSVWRCPVCSAKIAERRRVEIIAAMEAHKAMGGCVNMLTLTCPHQVKDNLEDLLQKQAKALNAFWSNRLSKAIFKEMGVIGQIRALEVTHGRKSAHNNGWHPHYHVLQFGGVGVDLACFDALQMRDWQVRLYVVWSRCCVNAGLGNPSYAHGLKLDDGAKAGQYVSKWGLEDEMTKGHTKKATHGETPFDFLRSYLADKNDKQAAALFIEFAQTFEGKRQLHWSAGLKKRFAIGEKTDEQLAAVQDDFARVLGTITLDQWRDVLAVDGRSKVLVLAAADGWDSVTRYLQSIRSVRGVINLDTIEARKPILPC
jgi:Replication protein